jgi:hypothetical protein
MEGYQMFSIFIPKKGTVEKKPTQTENKEE